MITQTQQFLGHLGVPHASRQTLFKVQRDLIAPVVDELAEAELAEVLRESNSKDAAKVQMDEQHSRPQKSAATIGAAPFVTATAINDDELIIAIAHEDASNNKGGAVKRVQRAVFEKLNKGLTVPLSDVVTDSCSSAHTTMKEVFDGSIHETAYLSHDLWHETKSYEPELSSLRSTRTAKYARAYKYPMLLKLFEEGKMSANKLKSWWVNLSTLVAQLTTLSDQQKIAAFEYMWRGSGDHYARKYGLMGADKDAFEDWLETKISSVPFFIHGLTTSQGESLHSLNNKYAIKGKIRSFLLYKMRKNIALLHWNELKRVRQRGKTDGLDDWDDDSLPITISFRRSIALKVISRVKL
jgi:hypothetical protein